MPEPSTAFQVGDRVRHASKPEWGLGHVARCSPETIEGKPAYRLTVRFERVGVKALSTAHASLIRDDQTETGAPGAQQAPLSDDELRQRLERVPEEATDPFKGPLERLSALLDAYRHKNDPRALLDWATAQTGLTDPLSRLNRHDLEDLFGRFRVNLDRTLAGMVRETTRGAGVAFQVADLQRVIDAAPPEGRAALRRAKAMAK